MACASYCFSPGSNDSFKGTVEQGCPLCKWWGMAGAFNKHWSTHSIIERTAYNIKRWWRKNA